MDKNFSREQISYVLVEADFTDDRQVCAKWGISILDLGKFREQLQFDSKLLSAVDDRRRILLQRWGEAAKEAVLELSYEVRRRAKFAETEADAKCLTAICNAAKIFGELSLHDKGLDIYAQEG